MRSYSPFAALLLFCTLYLFGCDRNEIEKGSPDHIRQVTKDIDDITLLNADQNHENWLTYGRNYNEDRYSELDQISLDNISELGLAWAVELGTKRGIQATPLVVDGIMFFTGPWSVVYAVDVRKGIIIWNTPGVRKKIGW